eukprot:Lankesteria_metandrocarpae@DN2814_c0_g1_i2.p1
MANATQVALPTKGSDGVTGGWYIFEDKYLSPEVTYTAFPKSTTIKIGGRYVQADRAVGVKIRLLEPDEDHDHWTCKKQHQERINLGEFHLDFSDVEVSYSFTSPQTHMWFCGYSIHMDCLESLTFTSYNVTVTVLPEHILPFDMVPSALKKEGEKGSRVEVTSDGKYYKRMEIDRTKAKTLKSQKVDEVLPFYSCAVPKIVDTLGDRFRVEYVHTPQHLNDCDRKIRRIDAYDGTVGVSQYSHPSSHPPIHPPVNHHELDAYISKGPAALPFVRGYNPSVVDCPKNVHDLKVRNMNGRHSKPRLNGAPIYADDRLPLSYHAGQSFRDLRSNDTPRGLSHDQRMTNLRAKYSDAGPGGAAHGGAHGLGSAPVGHQEVSTHAGWPHSSGPGDGVVSNAQRSLMLPPGSVPKVYADNQYGINPLAPNHVVRAGSSPYIPGSPRGGDYSTTSLQKSFNDLSSFHPKTSSPHSGRAASAPRIYVDGLQLPGSTVRSAAGSSIRSPKLTYASVRAPEIPVFSHAHSGLYPVEHYPADESQTAALRLSQMAKHSKSNPPLRHKDVHKKKKGPSATHPQNYEPRAFFAV